MIKAVIFDLDGVLVHTDRFHYLAWKAIADGENIPFGEEENNKLRGVSRMASLEIILSKSEKKYSPEEKNALCDKKNAIYRTYLEKMTPQDVDKDVLATLKTLKEKGYRLAVGSASKNAPFILEKTQLAPYFDAIADGTVVTHSKPDPEVFLKAAEMLEISPKDACVVEDAFSGIEAAKRGNFLAFGIGDTAKDEEADASLEKLSDLLGILEKKNTPRLEIKHVYKTYPNGFTATRDFNLDVYDGEFVVFVGPSGCGKSTMLRMIAGLEEVTSGVIFLDGKDITDEDARDRNIAMVFQNYALYPQMSVRKNIAFPLTVEHVPPKHFFDFKYRRERKERIEKKVEETAEKIGLTDYLDARPANLSGGQRQRVALGRAIVRDPKIFLLDEPLSNLDAKTRVQMRSEISRLHEKLKAIFIYVTHDQVEAMTMGSKIVVLKEGVIQQVGTPSEVFLEPANSFVASFIGTPQMNFFDVTVSCRNDGEYSARFRNSGNELPLPGKRMEKFPLPMLGKTVQMGIRPKAVSMEGDPGFNPGFSYRAEVSLFEQLGEETIVYLNSPDKDGDLIVSTTGLDRFHKSQSVRFSCDTEHVCFFSKENGNSLLK